MNSTDRIVIVGGGTAGWFSAITLNKYFPNKNITCIESKNVPRVGVGESTLEHFTYWLHAMGIPKSDLYKHADASVKLSLGFTDFYKKDSGTFHYPFGYAYKPTSLYGNYGLDVWQYKKILYPDTPVQDYADSFWSQMALIHKNRYHPGNDNIFKNFEWDRNSAFHFDAIKFANFLRDSVAIPRGVTHIPATVVKVNVNEDGIENVVLDDGTIVEGDLYIDCTGWKSILMNELDNEFIDYGHLIPNNRAWATKIPYTDKRIEMQPWTNATALGNGWCWNIPCYSRIGTGYAYSDKYTTPEDALDEFKTYLRSDKMAYPSELRSVEDFEYKDISMRIGIHHEPWKQNCVAIGLAAGFIEPLESTGLFTTHEFIMKLAEVLQPDHGYNRFDINHYNQMVRGDFDSLCKFVSCHYAYSRRDDTQYWKDIRNRDYNGSETPIGANTMPINYSEDYFTRETLKLAYYEGNLKDTSGISAIMVGCETTALNQVSWDRLVYYNVLKGPKYWEAFLEYIRPDQQALKDKWNDAADKSPYICDWIRDTYHS